MSNQTIDPKIYELYDEYCHTSMSRREFFSRAAAITVIGGLTGCTMAKKLLPDYKASAEVAENDERIETEVVTYASLGGNSGSMKGYLVKPKGPGPFPAVLVVHENRGLNPYVKDVARRMAAAGFLTLAPDALSVVGGYPGTDDEGKEMQAKLDKEKILIDMKNSAYFLKNHKLSTKKLGVVGFCFGGGVSNSLAVEMGSDLQASAPFYGGSPKSEDVKKIKAKMLIHFAEVDERVNAMRSEYEAALKMHKINFEMFTYPGTQHGFHNYSTPRFDQASAKLAEARTIAFFKQSLM